MARVSTYLNFERSTEDAFNFYRSVFGTQFSGPTDVGEHRHDQPRARLARRDR